MGVKEEGKQGRRGKKNAGLFLKQKLLKTYESKGLLSLSKFSINQFIHFILYGHLRDQICQAIA